MFISLFNHDYYLFSMNSDGWFKMILFINICYLIMIFMAVRWLFALFFISGFYSV